MSDPSVYHSTFSVSNYLILNFYRWIIFDIIAAAKVSYGFRIQSLCTDEARERD